MASIKIAVAMGGYKPLLGSSVPGDQITIDVPLPDEASMHLEVVQRTFDKTSELVGAVRAPLPEGSGEEASE